MCMKSVEKPPVDTDLGENYFQDWPSAKLRCYLISDHSKPLAYLLSIEEKSVGMSLYLNSATSKLCDLW